MNCQINLEVEMAHNQSLKKSIQLFVVFPFALVSRPVGMAIGTIAISLIVLPFAYVYIHISVYKSAFAIGLVISPITFV